MDTQDKNGYFHRLHAQTPTRFWVNNPSRDEADWAITAGAVGCTCNPSFGQKMLDHPSEKERRYASALLDEAIASTDNDSEAHVVYQRTLVKPIMEKFLPLHQSNPRRYGFVSIQGDPIKEHDPNVIIEEGRGNRVLGTNACIKIPCTESGLKAMEVLIAEDVAINATEIMGYDQAVTLCELYERVTKQSGKNPPMFLSHIAGIYDDYLKVVVERDKIDISPDVLHQAGLAIARKVYGMMIKRGYDITLVGGGARGVHHFTEMVGGDLVVTINWRGTADKLLDIDPPVMYRLFNPVPAHVIEELMEKLPDFKRGYLEGGLSVEEYADFGPVVHFLNSFTSSWKRILGVVEERRAAK